MNGPPFAWPSGAKWSRAKKRLNGRIAPAAKLMDPASDRSCLMVATCFTASPEIPFANFMRLRVGNDTTTSEGRAVIPAPIRAMDLPPSALRHANGCLNTVARKKPTANCIAAWRLLPRCEKGGSPTYISKWNVR
jgi:hypothetical protein